MPQFRLTTPHYMHEAYLEAGTLVGDGTPYPIITDDKGKLRPSLGMVGVDDESQAIIDKHYDENVRRDPLLPESGKAGDEAAATADLTINRPNPNLSPPPPDASQGGDQLVSPARTTADPLSLTPGGPGPVRPAAPTRSPTSEPSPPAPKGK